MAKIKIHAENILEVACVRKQVQNIRVIQGFFLTFPADISLSFLSKNFSWKFNNFGFLLVKVILIMGVIERLMEVDVSFVHLFYRFFYFLLLFFSDGCPFDDLFACLQLHSVLFFTKNSFWQVFCVPFSIFL